MEDPLPENIDGSVRVSHAVEHQINWSHVAAAVVVLIVAWRFGPALSRSSSSSSPGEEPAV
jgi:hypothetical protein